MRSRFVLLISTLHLIVLCAFVIRKKSKIITMWWMSKRKNNISCFWSSLLWLWFTNACNDCFSFNSWIFYHMCRCDPSTLTFTSVLFFFFAVIYLSPAARRSFFAELLFSIILPFYQIVGIFSFNQKFPTHGIIAVAILNTQDFQHKIEKKQTLFFPNLTATNGFQKQ